MSVFTSRIPSHHRLWRGARSAPGTGGEDTGAFFSFDWEGTALQAEFRDAGMEQFLPISYQEHWSVVRTIDEATNTIYNCD